MATPNISAVLSSEDIAEIKSHVQQISERLQFAVNIEPKDKKKYNKMSPGSVSLCRIHFRIAKSLPEIIPLKFSVAEFEKDVNLTDALSEIASVLIPLCEGVKDTLLVVGSEAMTQANVLYGQVKLAAKTDANVDEFRKQLGSRYKGQRKKTKPAAGK